MPDCKQQVFVTVIDVKGSAPREVGATMMIYDNQEQMGTIGGGALEWQATNHAMVMLADHRTCTRQEKEFILGPDLEQCCGGVVRLSFEVLGRKEYLQLPDNSSNRQNLMLFGAGHVGKALVRAIAEHDFNLDWIDNRKEVFPDQIPENTRVVLASKPAKVLADIPDSTFVLIMTHCHKLDYDIVKAALQNTRTGFVGLIGSGTKKARFVNRLAADGLNSKQISRLVCPIGVTGIYSKKPAAIAAAVLAQLLIEIELVKTGKNTVRLRQNRA